MRKNYNYFQNYTDKYSSALPLRSDTAKMAIIHASKNLQDAAIGVYSPLSPDNDGMISQFFEPSGIFFKICNYKNIKNR